ncbi:MAG: N-acyl-D-amino-acid deacylase family protein [Minwuia sp.]|uniref:N-acyl-D-amino-acid deacylase family protein n=1 Tax=Minwuia sp. TaxID=2493630 RepID=UPI003A83A17B
MPDHDLLIRNARLIDGSGGPSRQGDLAISGGRIAEIGTVDPGAAREVVDAKGLALAPGFIDSHCHDDRALIDIPDMTPKASQGVTTVINGNCGVSAAPFLPGRPEGPPPLNLINRSGEPGFESFDDYFGALEARPAAINHACLCGHINLRNAFMDDFDRPATATEIGKMCDLLDRALSQGALGLSTGLYYPPAEHAPTEEVIGVSKVLAKHKALYVTHMRDEADHVTDSLEETFTIGRAAGVPVIVSHHKCTGAANKGKSKLTLEMIAAARENQTVGVDAYPYTASSTILQPDRIDQSSRVIITWSKTMPEATGRDLSEIADEMGCSMIEAAERLSPGGAIYFTMDEDDVSRILAWPDTMIGSDGIVMDRHPHPRAWGTFPRVLGHYARDRGLFTLEQAVRKMTSLTAETFGLKGRGRLEEGFAADLVLFDPDTIIDSATFAEPKTPAAGIERVFVNGQPVWQDGAPTGARPGQRVRRSA